MAGVTLNAKGTSVSSFKIGKNGTVIDENAVITPPAGTDVTLDIDTGQFLIVAGTTGAALITASNSQDLHINPATGGGQYLVLNANRWPATDGTNGQTLITNGSGVLSWSTLTGTGTVTSVDVSTSGVGISVSGSPITTSGTITLTSNATSANTASTIVSRDASGNFTAGIITATTFNATSTKAVKKRIKNINKSYLDKFSKLKPREYDRKDYAAHEFGFIAEEMALVYPEVVSLVGNKPTGIDYGKLSTILTAKVQEQQKLIEDLQKQVADIKKLLVRKK